MRLYNSLFFLISFAALVLFRVSIADLIRWSRQRQTDIDAWCQKCKHFDVVNFPNRTMLYNDESDCLELLLNLTSSLEREVEIKSDGKRLIITRVICTEVWRNSSVDSSVTLEGVTQNPVSVPRDDDHDAVVGVLVVNGPVFDDTTTTTLHTEQSNNEGSGGGLVDQLWGDVRNGKKNGTVLVAVNNGVGSLPILPLVIVALMIVALLLITCYFCLICNLERLQGIVGDPNFGDVPLRAIRAPGIAVA